MTLCISKWQYIFHHLKMINIWVKEAPPHQLLGQVRDLVLWS